MAVDEAVGDYPALFRALLVRSVESALAAIAPDDPKLDDDARERSLYALSLALDLAEAWPAASQLLLTIAPHMEMQGYWHEWLEFLEKALERATAANDLRTSAHIHLLIGELYHLLHEYPAAVQHLTESRRLAEAERDVTGTGRAMERLAVAYAHTADLPKAKALAEETIAVGGPQLTPTATAFSVLGFIALRQANWHLAITYYERSLELHENLNNQRAIAQSLRNLAKAYRYAGNYRKATEYSRRAIAGFVAMKDIVDEAEARMNLGIEHWYLGEYHDALACYAACEPIFVKAGWPISLARLANNRGLAYRELGFYEQAQEEFLASLKLARQIEDRLETANVLESLGGLYQRMGKPEDAAAVWQNAMLELGLLPEPPKYLYELLAQRLDSLSEQRYQQEL